MVLSFYIVIFNTLSLPILILLQNAVQSNLSLLTPITMETFSMDSLLGPNTKNHTIHSSGATLRQVQA